MESELFKEGTAAEREHNLWVASEKYIKGEIKVKELEEIELSYASDFKAATLGLARQNMRWLFLIILFIGLFTITTIGVATFLLNRNPYTLAIIGLPAIYSIRLITRYLFPADERKFKLEAMKIQKREQRSPRVRQFDKEEL